jgi:hypothetical protein
MYAARFWNGTQAVPYGKSPPQPLAAKFSSCIGGLWELSGIIFYIFHKNETYLL